MAINFIIYVANLHFTDTPIILFTLIESRIIFNHQKLIYIYTQICTFI